MKKSFHKLGLATVTVLGLGVAACGADPGAASDGEGEAQPEAVGETTQAGTTSSIDAILQLPTLSTVTGANALSDLFKSGQYP